MNLSNRLKQRTELAVHVTRMASRAPNRLRRSILNGRRLYHRFALFEGLLLKAAISLKLFFPELLLANNSLVRAAFDLQIAVDWDGPLLLPIRFGKNQAIAMRPSQCSRTPKLGLRRIHRALDRSVRRRFGHAGHRSTAPSAGSESKDRIRYISARRELIRLLIRFPGWFDRYFFYPWVSNRYLST